MNEPGSRTGAEERKLRIGVTQRVEVVEAYGERRDALDQAWGELLSRQGFWPIPLPNRPEDVPGLVSALGLDGVILSGGNDLSELPDARTPAPERDAFEHALLDACTEAGLPVLGICRGMQLMVRLHGGELAKVDGHVATRHGLTMGVGDGPLRIEAREEVNSFHDWGVLPENLGKDLVALAHAADGTIEAVAHPTLARFGLMWHPERAPRDPRDGEIIRQVFRASP